MSAALLEKLNIEMPGELIYDISELGEGITLKSRRTVELDPKYAAAFLDFPEFRVGDVKVDRNLSEGHVIHLAREMLAGNFRWEQVNLCLAELDGRKIRMNGQHTAWARLYADEQGLPPKTRCPVQLMHYECKTEADARRLYASLDRGRARGGATVVNSHLLGTEEYADVPPYVLKLLAAGLGVWLWEQGHVRGLHGGDDRAYLLLKEHHDVARHVADFIKDSKAKEFFHLKRAPVIGAMMATFQKNMKDSMIFWGDVKDGLGLSNKEDPRYILRNWLLRATLSKGSRTSTEAIIVGQEQMYRTCLMYWNAHRKGKVIKALRLDMDGPRPDVL
jgi:hypothetical protein